MHDGDCKDIEEAAGTEKAMKMLRELLSSDPVSSDEDMGDTRNRPHQRPRKERKEDEQGKKQSRCTATPLTWWRWLTQLREESYNVAASTSPTTRAGTVGHSRRRSRWDATQSRATSLKYGDIIDAHMPRAYASIVDPRYFPRGAILEQVDVMQLGKSVNFCVAPFDGAPLCRIGDDRSVFTTRDQANQLSHDLCRVLRHKIGNCRRSAFRCDEGGWVDIDAVIDDQNNDIFPHNTSRAKRYMGIMEVIKW